MVLTTQVDARTVPPALTTVSSATGLVVSDIPTAPSTTHSLSQTLGDSGTPLTSLVAVQTPIVLKGGGLGLSGRLQRQHLPQTQALQMVEVITISGTSTARSVGQDRENLKDAMETEAGFLAQVKEAEANEQHKSIIGAFRVAAPKWKFEQIKFVVGNRGSVVESSCYKAPKF